MKIFPVIAIFALVAPCVGGSPMDESFDESSLSMSMRRMDSFVKNMEKIEYSQDSVKQINEFVAAIKKNHDDLDDAIISLSKIRNSNFFNSAARPNPKNTASSTKNLFAQRYVNDSLELYNDYLMFFSAMSRSKEKPAPKDEDSLWMGARMFARRANFLRRLELIKQDMVDFLPLGLYRD